MAKTIKIDNQIEIGEDIVVVLACILEAFRIIVRHLKKR